MYMQPADQNWLSPHLLVVYTIHIHLVAADQGGLLPGCLSLLETSACHVLMHGACCPSAVASMRLSLHRSKTLCLFRTHSTWVREETPRIDV